MPKRKRTAVDSEDTSQSGSGPVGALEPTTSKRTSTRSPKKKSKQSANDDQTWDPYGSTTTAAPIDAEVDRDDSPLTDLDAEFEPNKRKKGTSGKRRRKKNAEPVVYDIPPVERKTIDFKGRLGYACLNTVLRAQKPEPVFCSRTCRKDTILKNGIEFAKELGLKNTKDLKRLIEWNEENKIRFLRISSEMFPFASHGELGYDLAYAQDELKSVGDLAKKLGHRLTTHPGQFTQLASPREAVIEASIRELEYHCQMMRYMGLGKDSVIILHMGGVYNDKSSTIARFRETYLHKLTQEMRDRLVLENDEMCYSVDDLLPICEELQVPIVLDYHHNWIKPSTTPLAELIPRINATWHAKGIHPKQHLSSPKPQFADGSGSVMDRRAHADRCDVLPAELGMAGVAREVDLMIEAKDKEQAVLFLYRIYGLEEVRWENLRPEKPRAEAKEEGADGGEKDGGEAEGEEGTPMKRRTRLKVKTTVEGQHDDISANAKEEESGDHPSPRKRTTIRKARIKQETQETVITRTGTTLPEPPTKPTKSRSRARQKGKVGRSRRAGLEHDDVEVGMALVNQEDAPEPVDGAEVGEVEAEEHPEAVGDRRRYGMRRRA